MQKYRTYFTGEIPLHEVQIVNTEQLQQYRGADKSLARPTFRCILFYGRNISLDASLVLYT
jgi:hypothetical protein